MMVPKSLLNGEEGKYCVPNLVDGKPVPGLSSSDFPVVSAKTQRVVHYVQNATPTVASLAVDSAARVFKTYKNTLAHERREMLLKAAALFDAKVDDFTECQMKETSCEESWARHNATLVASFVREIASVLSSVLIGDIRPSQFGFTTLVFKEAVGPVLIIPPWNAATILCVRGVANALAAGCTVVLKASELCPMTHLLIAETFHEAGFPPGAVNMVIADRSSAAEVTEAIIAHPSLRKVEFIGSAGVGRIIAGIAAKHLKPILLELGDQSPAIILDDADLVRAGHLCAQGAMLNHGQVCFSTERIIVQKTVVEAFNKQLVEAMKEIPHAGSAVSCATARKAKNDLDEAVSKGAKFVYGGCTLSDEATLQPSILTNVNSDSSIFKGEAFAPTAFIVAVDNEADAIEEANSRTGGLSASVFTQNYERGLRIARALEFGQVQINNMTLFAEPTGPVTGVKGSGWGSNNGSYGIEEFLYSKLVSLVPTPLSQI